MKKEGKGRGEKEKKTKKEKKREEKEEEEDRASFYVPETRMESKEVEEGILSLAKRKKRLGE